MPIAGRVFMKRFAVAPFAVAVLLSIVSTAPAAAHGCHQGWKLGPGEGWHSHGVKCEPRRGVGLSSNPRQRNKRRAG
jgi:hypothetical protein